jgi:TonB-linked SusC/RagA family outer membrane protein
MDEIYKVALQQSYNLSISGGSHNTNYMISFGYYDQESNFVGPNYGRQRFNFRTNLNSEWGNFKVASTMAYNRIMDKSNPSGTGSVNTNVFRVPQYYNIKFKEGDQYIINEVVVDGNSLAQLEKGGVQNQDNDNIIGNLNLEYAILEGLKAKALAGIDLMSEHRFRRYIQVPLYQKNDLENPIHYLNSTRDVDDLNTKYYTLNMQFLLDFNRTFASAHNVNALLGASNESYTWERNMVRWRYTDPDLGLNSGTGATQAGQSANNYTSNQNTSKRSITSLFGRAGYSYNDKYYFDFTFRYDGSSKFHKDHRWGFFPSFQAAYRISEENFMRSYKDNYGDLKLRASYGILGIQSVNDYAFMTTYALQTDRYGFNNVPTPGVNFTIGNEKLTWENSANFNVGFDASFFRNKLDFTFDFFHKRTYDMLLVPIVPSVFGTTSVGTQNLGEMTNIGWEVAIGYRVKTGDFSHRINFNLADAKNKVTDFGGREQITQAEEQWTVIREGEALGSYFGYKSDGLFQNKEEIASSALHVGAIVEPGDRKFVDQNKDGVIDENDRVILGNAFPRYTFGFTYDVAWKNFDLNIFIQGVGKREQMMRGEIVEPFHHDYWVATMYTHQLDFWTPDNPGAKYPRLATTGPSRENNWTRVGNDAWLHDMAYLRVKNIMLGYTLPSQITSKIGIEKARINVNVQNPFTLSKQSWVDPESTNMGNTMGGRGGAGAFMLRNNYAFVKYYGMTLDLEF